MNIRLVASMIAGNTEKTVFLYGDTIARLCKKYDCRILDLVGKKVTLNDDAYCHSIRTNILRKDIEQMLSMSNAYMFIMNFPYRMTVDEVFEEAIKKIKKSIRCCDWDKEFYTKYIKGRRNTIYYKILGLQVEERIEVTTPTFAWKAWK